MNLAPIIVFGFNRPEHMKRMLNSLQKNKESLESKVIFYIDGYDGINDKKINETLKVVNSEWNFKEKIVKFRPNNFGCKKNIIDGISEVLNTENKAIIIEDDLELNSYFLEFMNTSLEKYNNNETVWSISGWCHPQLINYKKGSSFSSLTSPWGWATWSKNWKIFIDNQYYEKNLIPSFDRNQKKKFLFYGFANYWEDAIKKDLKGDNSVWDAYWYQTIFINKGLTLFPNRSHVQNGGFDGSGLHCKDNDLFDTPINKSSTQLFPTKIKESLMYKLNTFLFFMNYRKKQYFEFHKSKFSSFENFKNFISEKLYK